MQLGMLGLLLMGVPDARAARPQIVTVTVTAGDGQPIANAWVRVFGTEGRRNVDPATGIWEASTLYHYDGTPLVFTKGLRLDVTVSAPGYRARRVEYVVRSRRNLVPVSLETMPEQPILPDDSEPQDELMVDWFEGGPEID